MSRAHRLAAGLIATVLGTSMLFASPAVASQATQPVASKAAPKKGQLMPHLIGREWF